ncbi:MAG: hypothetical protein K6D94_05810 [Clostridiales bacterium]|nr:hypothetical protein [Clostridiales bacterium]
MKNIIRIIFAAALVMSMLAVSSCGPGGHQPSANDVIHNFNTTAETEEAPETSGTETDPSEEQDDEKSVD